MAARRLISTVGGTSGCFHSRKPMRNRISQTFSRCLPAALVVAGLIPAVASAQGQEKSIQEVIAAATVAETPAAQRELILSLKLRPSA